MDKEDDGVPLLDSSRDAGLRDRFRRFSHLIAEGSGSPIAFAVAVALLVAWGVAGPYFNYSEGWQLVVNTATTIVTFLMVFVIQNTQARDSRELHVKLDELLRAVEHARNTVINCADLSDDELEKMEAELKRIAEAGGRRSEASILRDASGQVVVR